MLEEKNMNIVSSRKQSAWIKGCPLRITEVKLYSSESDESFLEIWSTRCTDRKIDSYSVKAEYYNFRRELIGTEAFLELTPPKSLVKIAPAEADHAFCMVSEVKYRDGETWQNTDNDRGADLPEQSIIWQTDPLYPVIKSLCRGKTEAKYYPDEILGGWRCTCGGINVSNSKACAHCGASKTWLDQSFDREYLATQKDSVAEGKKPTPANRVVKKEAEKRISDKAKMIIILAAATSIVLIALLSAFYISPQIRYNKAHKLATMGDYDKAIAIFNDLGKFKNSAELADSFTYEKFLNLTGVSDLYMTNSTDTPWFKITVDGELSFVENKYEGDYTGFRIPHVVDGIVVRQLEKSIFLNRSELTEIVIPDTVEIINEQAFVNCTSLESVTFGKKLTTIMPRAFVNCSSLKSVVIPNSITTLGQRAFNNCTSLERVELGKGIREIEAYTFSNCTALREIVISSPISYIGEYALSDCNALEKIICRFDETEWSDPAVSAENIPYESAEIIFE